MAAPPLRLGLAYLIIGLAPMAFAIRGVTETHVIAPTSITHVDGASYVAPIPPSPFAPVLVAASDAPGHEQRSASRLFEDGRELRPAHAAPVGIAAVGKGRFSHWTTGVYLSASDNSDPRTNGRIYRLESVARLPVMVTVAWALTLLLAAVVARFWRFGEPVPAWVPRVRPLLLAVLSAAAIAVMATAGSEIARVALAGWLVVGGVATVHAAIVMRRVSTAEVVTAAREAGPALVAVWDRWRSIGTSLEQRIFDAPGWRGLAVRVGCVAVPAGVFVATLTTAWPESVLAQACAGGGRVIVAAAAALWLGHVRRGWLAILFGLAVTLGLFGLALAAMWQDVTIHYRDGGVVIGGLLPWSDAQGYYYDALRLLDGHPLGWSARRPLFPAFLAVLLAVTRSLYVALAVMVALNAGAVFLLAREVRLSFGSAAATAVVLILFAYYRLEGSAGAVLTENLGFLLGTAGFTALLRGVRLQDIRSYTSGAVVLTAALMARAGAFFVLPALVAAALVSLRQDRWRLNVRSALVTLCAIAIAATTLLVWGRTVSNPAPENAAFSNYSYVVYGLVVGGKGWQQVHIDHPNAKEGAEIYDLAYEAFRARPSGVIIGMARMVRAYLWPSEPYHMFAFIQDGPRTKWLQRLCYLLVLVGLGSGAWRWRDPVHMFVLAVAAGHLASIPFVPPMDAGLRVYAATMPVLAVLVGTGIAASGRLFGNVWRYLAKRTEATSQAAPDITTRLSESAGLILVAVIIGTSWTLHAFGKPSKASRPSCPSGSESLLVRIDDGAVLRIADDREPRQISPTASRQSDVQRMVSRYALKAEASNIKAGMSMAFTYDLMDGRLVWLVGASRDLHTRSGLLQACGHYAADALARSSGLIYVDEARAAEPPR